MRILPQAIKLPSALKLPRKVKAGSKRLLKKLFNQKHLGCPFSSEKISATERIARAITHITIAVFTLGIYHSIKTYKALQNRFKPVEKGSDTFYQKADHAWKTFVGLFSPRPDFSYEAPKVDLSGLEHLTPEMKKKVEARCLEKMQDSMKALDPSMADGIRELLEAGELPEVKETVNKFSKRVLEVYQAYVDFQIEQKVIPLPVDIGAIKSGGFTHQEILKLREPCAWYGDKVRAFKEKLQDPEGHNLTAKQAQSLTIHIASCGYRWGTSEANQKRLSETLEETNSILKSHPDRASLEETCNEYCKELKSNGEFFNNIKSFDTRVRFIKSMSQHDKEFLKEEIAALPDRNPLSGVLGNDRKFRLLEEIRQRFEFRENEPGFVGSPLSMYNTLMGKHDAEAPDGNYRAKLFFTYGSKNIVNEILISPEMTAGVNRKLRENGCGWQIEDNIANLLRNRSEKEPLFSLGLYARENNLGNGTRHWKPHKEVQETRRNDPNHTFAEGERIAEGEYASPEDLMRRFRIKLSPQEEMAFFGSNSHLDAKEVRRKQYIAEQYLAESPPPSECSTAASSVCDEDLNSSKPHLPAFVDSPLGHKKRFTRMHWEPGKLFFNLHDENRCDSPYIHAVKDLGLPQYAGISGSSDQMFTLAGSLGIRTKEELSQLRLIYLPWMIAHQDHTADEIMTAVKSFGLPYTPAPDYYNQVYPSKSSLVNAIQKHQRNRGFELPDYYLSKEYAKKALEEVRKDQDEKVQDLLQNHQLLLKGMRAYKANYSTKDLFAVNKWKRASNEYASESIMQKLRKKVRSIGKLLKKRTKTVEFRLNPSTQMFEKFDPKKEMTLTGSELNSVSIIPRSGKVIPYVPFDWPDLNRTGYLFDENQSEIPEHLIFSADANVDIRKAWVKHYTPEEMEAPGFEERLIEDSREAYNFNTTHAHQTSKEKLVEGFEEKPNEFLPYNEVMASIKKEGMVGVFFFSKGLPTRIPGAKVEPETDVAAKQYGSDFVKFDYKPLQHESVVDFKKDEDYDRYMLMMGIARKIAAKEQFGKDLPLYEINSTTDTGLKHISDSEAFEMVQEAITDNDQLDGIVRCIKHQSRIKSSDMQVKKELLATLKGFLQKLQ